MTMELQRELSILMIFREGQVEKGTFLGIAVMKRYGMVLSQPYVS